MMSSTVLILIDADVLIHLFKAEKVSLLNDLFPKRLRMLDIVLNELRNNQTIRNNIDSIFLFSGITEIPLPTTSNPELLREYVGLSKTIKGDGERATLLYCKYYKHIIASSNTKVARYLLATRNAKENLKTDRMKHLTHNLIRDHSPPSRQNYNIYKPVLSKCEAKT